MQDTNMLLVVIGCTGMLITFIIGCIVFVKEEIFSLVLEKYRARLDASYNIKRKTGKFSSSSALSKSSKLVQSAKINHSSAMLKRSAELVGKPLTGKVDYTDDTELLSDDTELLTNDTEYLDDLQEKN